MNSVAWSPDDTQLAISGEGGGIHIRDSSTGEVVLSFPADSGRESVDWHPDGTRIAFVMMTGERPYKREIFVVDADGRNMTSLTADDGVWSYHPAWGP